MQYLSLIDKLDQPAPLSRTLQQMLRITPKPANRKEWNRLVGYSLESVRISEDSEALKLILNRRQNKRPVNGYGYLLTLKQV